MARRALSLAFALALGCGDDAPPACPPEPTPGECAADADCCSSPPCERRCVRAGVGEVRFECAVPVGPGEPGAACEGGDECASGLCSVAGRCVAPCGATADCAAGERCQRAWVERREARRATVCVPEASLPVIASETHERSASPVLAPAPFGAHHVLLPRCDARPRVLALDGASRLFDRDALAPGAPAPINPIFAPYPGVVTVALPSGLGGVDASAPHTLTLDEPATIDRLVFAPGSGTTLDLDLFLVGVSEPPAESFDPLRAMLASAGASLGDVRVHEVTGDAVAALSVLEAERGELPELEALFALGAGLPPSVPVFAVRHVDLFLGLAGGIPAALPTPGSPASGVVVGVETAGDALGMILAHEVAHALGLFHLVEADGSLREPLDDTPVCPPSADADGDGLLDPDECADAGATNPLFWSIERAGTALTDDQAAIVLRSPVLR